MSQSDNTDDILKIIAFVIALIVIGKMANKCESPGGFDNQAVQKR
jgi:hypothetical protein